MAHEERERGAFVVDATRRSANQGAFQGLAGRLFQALMLKGERIGELPINVWVTRRCDDGDMGGVASYAFRVLGTDGPVIGQADVVIASTRGETALDIIRTLSRISHSPRDDSGVVGYAAVLVVTEEVDRLEREFTALDGTDDEPHWAMIVSPAQLRDSATWEAAMSFIVEPLEAP